MDKHRRNQHCKYIYLQKTESILLNIAHALYLYESLLLVESQYHYIDLQFYSCIDLSVAFTHLLSHSSCPYLPTYLLFLMAL